MVAALRLVQHQRLHAQAQSRQHARERELVSGWVKRQDPVLQPGNSWHRGVQPCLLMLAATACSASQLARAVHLAEELLGLLVRDRGVFARQLLALQQASMAQAIQALAQRGAAGCTAAQCLSSQQRQQHDAAAVAAAAAAAAAAGLHQNTEHAARKKGTARLCKGVQEQS